MHQKVKVTTRTTNSTITITTAPPAFQTTVEYCKYYRWETATARIKWLSWVRSVRCAWCAHTIHMLCYFIAWNEYTHNFPHIFQFGQNKFIGFTIHILYKEHSGNQFHEWTTKTNTRKKNKWESYMKNSTRIVQTALGLGVRSFVYIKQNGIILYCKS